MGRWEEWKKENEEANPEELIPLPPPIEIKKKNDKGKEIEKELQNPLQNIDKSLLFIKIPDYKEIIEEIDKLDGFLKEMSEKIVELEKQKKEEMLHIEKIKQKIVKFEGILTELDKKFSGNLK